MLDRKTLLMSLLRGTGITLITGLVPRKTLLGATHYGWPIAWLIRIVSSSQHNPWRILPIWFVLDIAVWSLFAFLLVYFLQKR